MAFFARFTERGQKALVTAQKEAAMMGRTYVGTEHLLLGVLSDPGKAAGILNGITVDRAREEIIALLGKGEDDSPMSFIPFMPR